MKNILIIATIILSFLTAQSFDEYKKSQSKEFKKYQDEIDKEFSKLLDSEWGQFDIKYKQKIYKKPKPIQTPSIKSAPSFKQTKKSKIVEIKRIENDNIEIPHNISIPKDKITIKAPKKILDTSKPNIKTKAPVVIPALINKNYKKVKVGFYGLNLSVEFDKKMLFYLYDVNEKSIAHFWDKISNTDYKPLVSNLNELFIKYSFNDWGRYLFLQKLGYRIYSNKNKANLFTWFMLTKMGYNVKVGFNEQKTYLLSTFKHNLYQIAFFNLKDENYYVLTTKGRISNLRNIKTFSQNYKNATKKFSFFMDKDIVLGKDNKIKNIKVTLFGKKYRFKLIYNKNRVDFYRYMPQSGYKIYLNRDTNDDFSYSILSALKPLIKGKSEIEATNIILRFVQLAFAYKTDEKQFTYEKVMFPEETLYYPYSDCEDRAIMFKFLVNKLLNLKVVAIKFPSHLSTAVAFSTKVKGYSFSYKQKRYVMADPTYINSSVGMIAPAYKKSKFKIID
jgi:hypothetical protein